MSSYAAGNGYMVDDVGPVCEDFFRLVYGIPIGTWNTTRADLFRQHPEVAPTQAVDAVGAVDAVDAAVEVAAVEVDTVDAVDAVGGVGAVDAVADAVDISGQLPLRLQHPTLPPRRRPAPRPLPPAIALALTAVTASPPPPPPPRPPPAPRPLPPAIALALLHDALALTASTHTASTTVTPAPPVLTVDSGTASRVDSLQPAQARRSERSLFAALSDAGSASPAAFQQEMLEALSCAPTQVLLAAAAAVHAASLHRGVLLTPSDQLARRGVSSVSHNTMPCVCDECKGPGTWRNDQDVLALICCRTCMTAIHQSFACSRVQPWQMQLDGWQCSSCQADGWMMDV